MPGLSLQSHELAMVQPRRTRVVDRLQTRQRGPGIAGLLGMGESAPYGGRTQADLWRRIRRQDAAAGVHDDPSPRQAFEAGCRNDLRLGCRPERICEIAAGQHVNQKD